MSDDANGFADDDVPAESLPALRFNPSTKEDSFLQSALTSEGRIRKLDDFLSWLNDLRVKQAYRVEQIPFQQLDLWNFSEEPMRLVHASGKFFSVGGVRVRTDFGALPQWDQPIIHQPEIGILGIITKVFDGVRYFLMHAKMEPGNIGLVQLSPTVQATRSNYTCVHKGNLPKFLEYFVDRSKSRLLVDQLQVEQGARYFRKRNRNMVVEVDEDLPHDDRFCWLTLGQIKRLLAMDNIVHMETRSVLSCLAMVDSTTRRETERPEIRDRLSTFGQDLYGSMHCRGQALHNSDEVLSWHTDLISRYELSVERISLNQVQHWQRSDSEIRHASDRYFSVIAVSVAANDREVASWTQPLLKHPNTGLIGFATQRFNDTLHFLVRGSVEPGNLDTFQMGPTVACCDAELRLEINDAPLLLKEFLQAPAEQIRYDSVQSEEGGRYFRWQNRYMIIELPPSSLTEPPPEYLWMPLDQITEFMRHGYFNIEARNLLACLDVAADQQTGRRSIAA